MDRYRALALLILAVFYGIYFTKLLVQRRRGIRTHQIGRRKERGLHTVETLLSVATFGIVPVQLLAIAFGWSCLPDPVRLVGAAVGLDVWRAGIPDGDRTELVTGGIYAVSRNPAFLGFDLMYLGVLLLFCGPLTALFTAFAVVMLHLQILQEERYLTGVFGAPYQRYRRRVGRYLGRWGR